MEKYISEGNANMNIKFEVVLQTIKAYWKLDRYRQKNETGTTILHNIQE